MAFVVKSGLIAALATLAMLPLAQASDMEATCENLGPSNDVCVFMDRGIEVKPLAKPTAAATGATGEMKMTMSEELKGGALDIDDAFEASTALDDGTEIFEANQVPGSLALESAFKAQAQIKYVESYLSSISGPTITGRVSQAGH